MQQYNTRIQLKSDTEAKWRLVETTFKPLAGEMIIYSADETHSYCRVKIGDGSSNLASLDFLDSGTINGNEVEIVKLASFADRPSPGSPDKLYIDMSTNAIYHYDGASGYTQLSNFTLNTSRTEASKISQWRPGVLTEATLENNILKITNGQLPVLAYSDTYALVSASLTPNNNS